MLVLMLTFLGVVIALLGVVFQVWIRRNDKKLKDGDIDESKFAYIEIKKFARILDKEPLKTPTEHVVRVRNTGQYPASKIKILAKAIETGHLIKDSIEKLDPGKNHDTSLGVYGGRRDYTFRITWKDGRFGRQKRSIVERGL